MSPVFGAANSGAAPIPVDYAPGMPVPPPMFLAGGLAPFPPHYAMPGGPYPAFAPMQLPTPPPEDTIYQGTVTNFGFAAKDGSDPVLRPAPTLRTDVGTMDDYSTWCRWSRTEHWEDGAEVSEKLCPIVFERNLRN